MSDENERPDDDAQVNIPPRFFLQLTLVGVLLALLVFANGLPGLLGFELPRLVLATPEPGTTPTAVVPTPTPRTAQVIVETPAPVVAITPTPVPAGKRMAVGNTGSDGGVWLRRSPKLADHAVILVDGTQVDITGDDVTGDGITWKPVRDPQGNTGFIPAQYLVPVP